MPARTFPWLSEVEAEIRAKVDSKRREPGQPKFDNQEMSAAYNGEHRFLHERISSMDRDFNVLIDDTLTVTSGSETTDLSVITGLRVIRALFELDGSGNVCREIDVGPWHEMGGSCSREALYRPYPQADLVWLNKPQKTFSLRVVYSAYPPHLFHGCVQSAGSSILGVEGFEPISDGHGVNRNILIYEGDASGSERTVSAYSGADREITVTAAFSPLPTQRSRYTSRPDLPYDAYESFVYGVCARLVEKFRDARFGEFIGMRDQRLHAMFTALNTLDRRGPLETYDMEPFGHGDPEWDLGY